MIAFEIREAVPADADAVADYHDRCFRTTYSSQVLAGEFEAPDLAGTRQQLHDWFLPESGLETRVAVVDGAPIGHVTVSGHQLVHLFVEPSHQHIGLGRHLLALGEAMIAAGGHTDFELHARVENVSAIAFYERAGWAVSDCMIHTVEHGISYDERVLIKRTTVTTWHHGLIAQWWANFNLDGPEIAFFRSYVASGQPALDVGCGSGRLLVPWVADGLDVDGVDASADMIGACRVAARAAGCEPILYVQPTHRLDLPRRYRTIISCGAFGLGGSRADDTEGLRRLCAHLLPGGVLALDYEIGEFDDDRWRRWRPRPAVETPPPSHARRLGPDGFHYALRHRVTAVDVTERSVTRELAAWQWQGDELVAHETHALVANVYSSDEIVTQLATVGFSDVRVLGGYHGGAPTELDRFHVFVATTAG